MRVLIPVDEAGGLESPISDEFGEAPFFLVVDGDRVEVYRNEEVIKGRGRQVGGDPATQTRRGHH